jgi:hypothetical protein
MTNDKIVLAGQLILADVKISNHPFNMFLDRGGDIIIISWDTFKQLNLPYDSYSGPPAERGLQFDLNL